jgi:hypothetical protein
MPAANSVIVNTPPCGSPVLRPVAGPRQPPGSPIAGLASLVDHLVDRLEEPTAEPADALISGCNAALESCLELLRDASDRDDLVRTAKDDLQRFARLLKLVDGPDVAFVLRQIRRILGRFDACGGGLAVTRSRGD